MKRPLLWFVGAWAMYVAAWFVPVHASGVHLPRGLPGWEAFRIAASPIWPYRDTSIDSQWIPLSVLSATTNLVMLGSLVPVLRRARTRLRLWIRAAVLSFAVDSFWLVWNPEHAGELRPGYYLWWVSFLALAFGLRGLRRLRSRAAS